MPIYEQTYRRHEARGPLRRVRAFPITREALRLILVKRAFLGLLALAWIPFLVRLIQIYVVTRFPDAKRVVPVDGRLFGQFLNSQLILALFLSTFGGAGLIANDLRSGAILVYLSRPLTKADYILGKLGVLLALNASATLLPAVLLYLVGIALAPDLLLSWGSAWILPAILLDGLVITFAMSLFALACSALAKSARVAGLGFVSALILTDQIPRILKLMWDVKAMRLLSPWSDLRLFGEALFGLPGGRDLPWILPAAALLLLGAGSLLVLRSRVRAVEVVS
jgi:ABC-type transport system involved in multi-copper enzyme maturation permease subunit